VKDTGKLKFPLAQRYVRRKNTNDIAPFVISQFKWDGFGNNTAEGVMLKTARAEEMTMNNISSAKCLPGHILTGKN